MIIMAPTSSKIANDTKNILTYSSYDYTSKFYKEILLRRRKLGIRKGVMMLEKHKKLSSFITFATKSEDFDEFDFVFKNKGFISAMKSDCLNAINHVLSK